MKSHWENIYSKKGDQEVSWYQETPSSSLDLINKNSIGKDSEIIDVGAGNSNLIIELNKQGFKNLTALDISGKALERTKEKLGPKADEINWVETDILDFEPDKTFDVWHDRAVFHFLTDETEIKQYVDLVSKSLSSRGLFILSTFSSEGPLKCSGLEISQYNEAQLVELFGTSFDLKSCFTKDHITPFDTKQNFIHAVFSKK